MGLGRAALALRPRLTVGSLRGELAYMPGLVRAVRRGAAARCCSPAPDVLLIPGMFSGDASLGALAAALEADGHATGFTGMRVNVDCSELAVQRLEAHAERVVGAREAPVALVGHSRGGLFARALAVRRPDLVHTVVSLGSPHRDQLDIHPVIWAGAWGLVALGRLGVRGVVDAGCARGRCCDDFRRQLGAPLAPRVRFVSVYSRTDGLVNWRACVDPAARNLEVPGPHLGFTTSPAVIATVRAALARPDAVPERLRALPSGCDVHLADAA